MGWKYPTQVQESVISLALENKNIMARARTGSGKTAAFLLPTIHKVVQYVSVSFVFMLKFSLEMFREPFPVDLLLFSLLQLRNWSLRYVFQ